MLLNRDGELKLFNQFGRFSLIISLSVTALFAQSFADFKHMQSASFAKFRDKKDNEFSKYLQAQWREYKAYTSQAMYAQQKPKIMPTLAQNKPKNVGPRLVIKIKNTPLIKPFKKQSLKEKDVSFDFFGTNIGFNFDKNIKNAKFYPRNQNGISNFFTIMATSDYDEVLYKINATCKGMELNDWGMYLLVTKLAQSIFLTPDDAKLFSWFMFNKLGFRVKVALGTDKHIVLLHEIKGTMYSTPSYTFGDKVFYVIADYNKANIGNIYTYAQDYPDAKKALDFTLKKLPNLEKKYLHKTLSFKEYGKVYTASYRYNQNLLNFMGTYPQVDYKIYFNTPLEYETYKDIAKDLKKYTDNKKASEALNFVLHFVQKAFEYERDSEQFGREKVMFAEETLCYKKSDCEDRAVLYARLIKDLFGIGVVGVKYNNHMSTALHIPISGDSVKVAGERYVIADPTYINASLGQNIPKYKSIIPENFIYIK